MKRRSGDAAEIGPAEDRACGACSLCCTVLRVDEIGKLGGTPCAHQRAEGGCAIHAERPRICRRYFCMWRRGGLAEADRPDRLGAVVDVVVEGNVARLSIQEAAPAAFDASPRLRAIAEQYREQMPVRVVEFGQVLDADRPFRVLLAGGVEHRVRGDRIEHRRDGVKIAEQRLDGSERLARRLIAFLRGVKIRLSGLRRD